MTESPIFTKMFDFAAWVIPLTTKFPREQRFVLASAVQRVTLAGYEALIRAGQQTAPASTITSLADVATQLALMQMYIRLSEKLALITTAQYTYCSEQLTEIGKLASAWRRNCQAKLNQAVPNATPT